MGQNRLLLVVLFLLNGCFLLPIDRFDLALSSISTNHYQNAHFNVLENANEIEKRKKIPFEPMAIRITQIKNTDDRFDNLTLNIYSERKKLLFSYKGKQLKNMMKNAEEDANFTLGKNGLYRKK